MDAYARELELQAFELRIECEMAVLPEYNDAIRVLDKIAKL